MFKTIRKFINSEKTTVVQNSKTQELKSKPSLEELTNIFCATSVWSEPSMVISKDSKSNLLKISLLQNEKKKISIRVNFLDKKSKIRKEYWISHDNNKSDEMVWIDNLFFAAESSFIEPKLALEIISELLTSHTSALSKYDWLDSEDIDWPDDFP